MTQSSGWDGLLAPGSVLFGQRRWWGRDTATSKPVGFRNLPDARTVYSLLRDARGALNFANRQARDGS